jgi:hypothetical protein
VTKNVSTLKAFSDPLYCSSFQNALRPARNTLLSEANTKCRITSSSAGLGLRDYADTLALPILAVLLADTHVTVHRSYRRRKTHHFELMRRE